MFSFCVRQTTIEPVSTFDFSPIDLENVLFSVVNLNWIKSFVVPTQLLPSQSSNVNRIFYNRNCTRAWFNLLKRCHLTLILCSWGGLFNAVKFYSRVKGSSRGRRMVSKFYGFMTKVQQSSLLEGLDCVLPQPFCDENIKLHKRKISTTPINFIHISPFQQ